MDTPQEPGPSFPKKRKIAGEDDPQKWKKVGSTPPVEVKDDAWFDNVSSHVNCPIWSDNVSSHVNSPAMGTIDLVEVSSNSENDSNDNEDNDDEDDIDSAFGSGNEKEKDEPDLFRATGTEPPSEDIALTVNNTGRRTPEHHASEKVHTEVFIQKELLQENQDGREGAKSTPNLGNSGLAGAALTPSKSDTKKSGRN